MAQELETSSSNKAAIANEKGIVNPTYPNYNRGGWNASPGSCKTGFNPKPSSGIGKVLMNGFDVNIVKAINPKFTTPRVNRTLKEKLLGTLFIKLMKTKPYKESIDSHMSKDPSWFPQVPLIL